MQVRNLSGEMTLSPVSCSSCLLSHFISWLLLLSPVSYSCLQSHLLSPSPVSCLLSPVFPLLFYVFCRLFHSPVSHLIFHQSWADVSTLRFSRPRHIIDTCIAPFVTASRLSHLLRIQMHSVDAMGEDTTVLKKKRTWKTRMTWRRDVDANDATRKQIFANKVHNRLSRIRSFLFSKRAICS